METSKMLCYVEVRDGDCVTAVMAPDLGARWLMTYIMAASRRSSRLLFPQVSKYCLVGGDICNRD